jgi:adenylate cyclase, class 2
LRCTLTYKGPAQRAPHKSREEIETDVSDVEAFVKVFRALGYRSTYRYEKYRTTFAVEGKPGLILLDETPIGDFLELEGPPEWIDATAAQLGHTSDDYITASYIRLYRDHCLRHPEAVPDAMVFQDVPSNP